jgi:hypothetical protein
MRCQVFDERAYYEKSCQLLEYTRRYLTVTAMASYVLETMGYPNVEATPSKPKVLLIQNEWMRPDYEADLLTIGMRKVRDVCHMLSAAAVFESAILKIVTAAVCARYVYTNAAARKWRNRRAIPPFFI